MRITFGAGGWVAVSDTSLPGIAYVRFRLTEGERLKASELYVASADDASIEASDLRHFPLPLVESVVNDPRARWRGMLLFGMHADNAPDLSALPAHFGTSELESTAVEEEFRLAHGPIDGLTDEFLQDVARAYRAALARGERPNESIRRQLGEGTSLKTVQRWVYTARQRGIMPPAGTKGRAG